MPLFPRETSNKRMKTKPKNLDKEQKGGHLGKLPHGKDR